MSIGIVGLGYVGLPLAMEFAEAGMDVIGVDLDATKVAGLREGRSHIEDVPDARLGAVLERCSFTTRIVDAARGRGRPDLRADAAERQPRAGPRPAAGRRARARAASCARVS